MQLDIRHAISALLMTPGITHFVLKTQSVICFVLIGFIPDNKELDFSWDCHEFKVKLEIFCVVGPVNTSKFSENLFMAT